MATGGTADVYDDAVAGRVDVSCHPCGRRQKNTTATSVCLTCQEHLCDECCEPHRVFKAGEHHITTISSQDKIQTPVDMKGMDTCTEHGRVFQYHCKDHEVLCCERCHIKMHKKCENIFDIDDLLIEVEHVDLIQNIQSTLQQANEMINQSEANIKAITIRIDKVTKEIDSMKNHLKQEKEKKDAAKSVNTELKDFMSLYSDVQTKGTDQQRYIARFILARSYIASLSELKGQIEDDADNTILIKQKGTQTAEVETWDVACETDHTTAVSLAQGGATDHVCASDLAKENSQETQTFKLRELPTDRFNRIRGEKRWPYISSLDFLSDGRTVAIDTYNKKCLILGQNLQRLGSYDFNYDTPFCVTCFENNQLAVTLGLVSFINMYIGLFNILSFTFKTFY